MRRTLHLLTGAPALALPAIEHQRGHPETTVTVVLLGGAAPCPLPAEVRVRELGRDLDYGELLELIFESDQVIAW